MTLHIHDLLTRSQIGPLREEEIQARGYLRIRRGIYLPQEFVPANAPRWKARSLVTQARALSLTMARSELSPPILTMESALVVHGLMTWTNTTDITYRVEGNKGSRKLRSLRPVTLGDTYVAPVTERQLVSVPPSDRLLEVGGVLTAQLGLVAVDCARLLHPMSAVVAVSSVLRHASAFNPRQPERCRALEHNERERIAALLEGSVERRRCREAASIIEIADAGIETPGEGYLWWLLHCMLPADVARGLVTQPLIVIEGRRYFPDCALPSRKVSFEFDGRGKIPGNEGDFLTRHLAFLRAGWKPIRVEQRQLDNPQALIAYLLRELRGRGIPAHHPTGPLWKEISHGLLDPVRRY